MKRAVILGACGSIVLAMAVSVWTYRERMVVAQDSRRGCVSAGDAAAQLLEQLVMLPS